MKFEEILPGLREGRWYSRPGALYWLSSDGYIDDIGCGIHRTMLNIELSMDAVLADDWYEVSQKMEKPFPSMSGISMEPKHDQLD